MNRACVIVLVLGLLVGCGGGSGGGRKRRGGGATGAPRGLAYERDAVLARVGETLNPNPATVSGAAATTFAVEPPLPDGLEFDTATGEITGTPTTPTPTAPHVVTASNEEGSAETTLTVQVTPSLPADVSYLEKGFAIESLASSLSVPVKMAFAPDGRLFFNELKTGKMRIIDAGGALLPTPFAEVEVLSRAEQGLLGIALSPDFETDGHLFVYASVPASGGRPDRNQVIRFTAVGDVGNDPVVIVDDLPLGLIHNAGDLEFGPDGMLYVTVGDTGDSALAQRDGERAGRVLRFAPDGSVPGDNPVPGDPEWCRGLRNTFDLTFHPDTGGLFGSENGPTFGDEINYLRAGRNYEWEDLPPEFPGSLVGSRVTDWTPVIAPTGITFVTGGTLGAAYDDDLYVASYVEADLRRLVLSGAAFTDLDEERPFAAWRDEGGVDHKPLDVRQGPDGALYVSSFSAIWRITRYP